MKTKTKVKTVAAKKKMTVMTREQMLAKADQLDAAAAYNDAYRTAMERTTERTNGRLGHLNNQTTYAAHGKAAADKRKRAADLRAQAAGVAT